MLPQGKSTNRNALSSASAQLLSNPSAARESSYLTSRPAGRRRRAPLLVAELLLARRATCWTYRSFGLVLRSFGGHPAAQSAPSTASARVSALYMARVKHVNKRARFDFASVASMSCLRRAARHIHSKGHIISIPPTPWRSRGRTRGRGLHLERSHLDRPEGRGGRWLLSNGHRKYGERSRSGSRCVLTGPPPTTRPCFYLANASAVLIICAVVALSRMSPRIISNSSSLSTAPHTAK